MSFLKDKEWEEMDWLNRAVEPYTFSFNLFLAKVPSEYIVTYSDVISYISVYSEIRSQSVYSEIRLNTVVGRLLNKAGISKNDQEMFNTIGYENLFEFRLEPDTFIDLDNETIKGSLILVKKMESLNDDVIKELLPEMVRNILRINSLRASVAHVNEAMDILDCKEARSSSSVRKKTDALISHIFVIYRDNTWGIRNVDLAIKMLTWIKSYCENGDRCSLANLSKLKCMVHNGHPIYSMEEIK